MISSTYTTNSEKFNTCEWHLGENLGHVFEDHIYNVLSKELEVYYDQKVKINSTPAVRDDGKDIIIESPDLDIEGIFGHNFSHRDHNILKIYIECKSSDTGKIPYNSFGGNVSRIKEDNVDYYVLVTNTTITPYSYYLFEEALKKEGIEFVLIDHFLLHKYLEEKNALIGDEVHYSDYKEVCVEYQVNDTYIEHVKAYEVFLMVRNYTSEIQTVSLRIMSDRNWEVQSQVVERLLDPRQVCCVKFIAKKSYNDGLDDLVIIINGTEYSLPITIKGISFSYSFRPTLIGEATKKTIDKIIDNIILDRQAIMYIAGEAGTGKSRVIDEVITRLSCRNIDFYTYNITKEANTLADICEYLTKAGLITSKKLFCSLENIINAIDTKYRKRVIILEDIHNSSKELLDTIYSGIENDSHGVTFILVGRDDYSAGDMNYFSFFQRYRSEYPNTFVKLASLTDAETKQMIKSIIRGVPQVVLDKICMLSNNLPLYIIQVIEYLLDLKLVTLLNRNTVGIENVESFSAKADIPVSMHDLYTKRIATLKSNKNGDLMILFLYIAAYLGGDFSEKFINVFFEGTEDLSQILFEHRFIKTTSSGPTLMHESLKIFLMEHLKKNQKIKKNVAIWVTNVSWIYDGLNHLRKGQLKLWADDRSEAKSLYSTDLRDICEMPNYSSIDINTDYYYFFEELYAICDNSEQIKKVTACCVYIALHYHTPYEAIEMCLRGRKKALSDSILKNDSDFKLYLNEQMAHSYLNAGMLKKGETLLSELLSEVFMVNLYCDTDKRTIFDLYDKLANLYIKYNCYEIAKNYCFLSMNYAKKLGDHNLEALSYITTAKLYLYSDLEKVKTNIERASELLETGTLRIRCHNNVTILIVQLMENTTDIHKLMNIKDEAKGLLSLCIKNCFANSIIRLYMVLATLSYLLVRSCGDYRETEEYLQKGIEASIQYGIGTYIWQFYNLLAIVSIHKKEKTDIQAIYFNTTFAILKRQNLTFLGNCDLTYGNMLALTNILRFILRIYPESRFFNTMSQLSSADRLGTCDFDCTKQACQYECKTDVNIYNEVAKNLRSTKHGYYVLFCKNINYSLCDDNGYYIVLS